METYKMLIKLQEGWRAGLISNEPKFIQTSNITAEALLSSLC